MHTGIGRPHTGIGRPHTGIGRPHTGIGRPHTGIGRPHTASAASAASAGSARLAVIGHIGRPRSVSARTVRHRHQERSLPAAARGRNRPTEGATGPGPPGPTSFA